ncbi:3-dehydroquinate synthase [Sphingomonas sp. GCM10030256]|uniref:3-dehydroquinate synthase n=1 Tax=Sphingomonas sp. GCM10030256 TaxID=3273427 RepID=UPI00361DC932
MMIISAEAGTCSYDIIVGALEHARSSLRRLAAGRTLPVVTDERVWFLHGERLAAILPVEPILVPEGEAAKDWAGLRQLIARFTAMNLDRSSPVIALGGGSIGDLTGLASGLFKRGCPVIHIPTTLLAQADSAVGGKTAIDAEGQKNLVGMFHQPALVLADVGFLDTLDERQLRAGYAEIVKYALIGHQIVFDWLEDHGHAILSGNREMREEAVRQCIAAKVRVVEADPEDRNGLRALLNFGHTFAHAIESVAGLGSVLHGEAVSIGMVLASAFSAKLGLCPASEAARVRRHLAQASLPTTLAEVRVDPGALLPLMAGDKKNQAGRLRLVLSHGIGRAFLSDGVDAEQLRQFLASVE